MSTMLIQNKPDCRRRPPARLGTRAVLCVAILLPGIWAGGGMGSEARRWLQRSPVRCGFVAAMEPRL